MSPLAGRLKTSAPSLKLRLSHFLQLTSHQTRRRPRLTAECQFPSDRERRRQRSSRNRSVQTTSMQNARLCTRVRTTKCSEPAAQPRTFGPIRQHRPLRPRRPGGGIPRPPVPAAPGRLSWKLPGFRHPVLGATGHGRCTDKRVKVFGSSQATPPGAPSH